MEAVWDAIERWLRDNATAVIEQLRRPAAPEQISAAEKAVRRELPADYRESLLIHDGTSPEIGLLGGRELLALPQSTEIWKRYCRRVRPPQNRWWPVAQDPDQGDQHFLCLDEEARVVAFWHYRGEVVAVAPSFKAWMMSLLDDMERGFVSVEGSHLKFSERCSFRWPVVGCYAFIPGPGRSREH